MQQEFVNEVIPGEIAIIKKEIIENENPNKIVDIVEKILNFDKKQNGKGHPLDLTCIAKVFDHTCIKVLTPKQMPQRLLIALAQIKAGNPFVSKKKKKFPKKCITI